MASSLVPRSRRALLAATAAAVLAAPAAGHAAPKAPYPPPNHPAPITDAAPAGGHARTPSDREPALAQERYYGSYDESPATVAPARDATAAAGPQRSGGVGTATLVLATAAALAIGLTAGRAMPRLTRGAQTPVGHRSLG